MEQKLTVAEQGIIDAVRRRHDSDVTLRLGNTVPEFLGGELTRVDVRRGESVLPPSYAYVLYGQVEETYTSVDELARWVDTQSRARSTNRPTIWRFVTVPAIIALVITFTICAIVLVNLFSNRDGFSIPEILSNALTIILGFYFGSEVQRRTEHSKESAEGERKAAASE